MDPDRVIIFDTTLRDGEQSPGISLKRGGEARDRAAARPAGRRRDRGRVPDRLAGRLRGGAGDRSRGRRARSSRGSRAPTWPTSTRAYEGVRTPSARASTPSSRRRTSTSSTSSSRRARTSRARPAPPSRTRGRYVEDVEFSPMDATRADVEYTAEVFADRHRRRARRRSTSPTRSATRCRTSTPRSSRRLYELVPELRGVVLSVHCHDDLGLAVANSLAGVQAGARQVECAINGIGERAGNASLEEIVMLLHTRHARLGFTTGIVTTRDRAHEPAWSPASPATPCSPTRRSSGATPSPTSRASTRTACSRTARPTRSWTPRTVGLAGNDLVLGKHSGRHALQQRAAGAGLRGRRPGAEHGLQALQGAGRPQEARHGDGPRGARHRRDPRHLRGYGARVVRGRRPPRAGRRTPAWREPPGRPQVEGDFTGDGPVDAIFRAINAAVRREVRLREFRIDAVTGGQDALGEASVVLELGGQSARGPGRLDGHHRGGRARLRPRARQRRAEGRRGRGGGGGGAGGGAHARAVSGPARRRASGPPPAARRPRGRPSAQSCARA